MQTVEQLTILGLGLMGGSLGLAARGGVAARVHGYARREETRQAALSRGVADAVFDDPAEAVRGADLVVVCVPVLTIAPLVEACRDALPPGAVITDVGSTKSVLVEQMAEVLAPSGVPFVGSHPIAGSEETGIEAMRADLYDGAVVAVTPPDGSADEPLRRVVAFWRALGAVTHVCSPKQHDEILARTSHLPHLVAAALVSGVLGEDPDCGAYCGSGFRDTTRVAGGSELVWRDIVATNQEAILSALRGHAALVEQMADAVQRGDIEALTKALAEARRLRQDWQHAGNRA